jgi:general secretion pathway protein A
MFLEFYGFREQPFGVTPDPRFLYLSPAHREALASLYYGIEAGRGFMALIAKPGMGKTTLLFQLLQRFQSTARTAFVFQTQCNSREFMRFLLAEIGCEISPDADLVSIHKEFNQCLLREAQAGRRFIVVVDEAQNCDPTVLETIRLLSDFETPRAKLLQIVLAGQPELADKLARPSLGQLRQRISVLSRLEPLPLAEVEQFISYRLRIAGYTGGSLFTPEARKLITELSVGIPRNINNICFNALSIGCALKQKTISVDVLREVATDFDLSRLVADHAQSQTQPMVGKTTPAAAAATFVGKDDPLLSPTDAVAYMKEIIDVLNKRKRLEN